MRFFILFIPLLISLTNYAQLQEERKTKTFIGLYKLTWDDFKLHRQATDTKFAASVSSGFDYEWDYNIDNAQQNFSFKVNTRLYPYSSWVVVSKKSEHLLAHEQLHYNISELHARKLRKLISGYANALGSNIRRDLRIINKRVQESHYKMQALYDKETEHSKNQEMQLIWNKKIDSLLTVYEPFKQQQPIHDSISKIND